MRRAHIDDLKIRPNLPGENADGRTAVGEIHDHLDGHFLGKGGDPFGDDAVIRGVDPYCRMLDPRARGALQAGKPDRQFFQETQRARRFGKFRLAFAGLSFMYGRNLSGLVVYPLHYLFVLRS
jgi:hypothetical protein